MTDKPEKPEHPLKMFGFKSARIARLCECCGKRVATRKKINYVIGQIRFLCEFCAGESPN